MYGAGQRPCASRVSLGGVNPSHPLQDATRDAARRPAPSACMMDLDHDESCQVWIGLIY
jgi:hypothetical protein